MKPNFLVIGAMKCGTTQLCHLLGQHPDVFMCDPKEPNFFALDKQYEGGWDWYESLFTAGEGKTAIGEGSVLNSTSLQFPKAASRIVKHLPDAKLIYITRNPLERIESHWMHNYVEHNESRNFNKIIRQKSTYIDTSKYWKQISAYREYFPDERILVLFFKDFVANQEATIGKCFEFLDVEELAQIPITMKKQNKSVGKIHPGKIQRFVRRVYPLNQVRKALPESVKRPLVRMLERRIEARPTWDREVRQWVIDQLAEDTQQFLQFYGKPLDWWPDFW